MSAVTAVPIRPIARGSVLKLWVALMLLVAAGLGLAWLGTAPLQRITTRTGLQYQVLKAGTGPTATANDVVVFHYEGRMTDGTLFDSSRARGEPMDIPPTGDVIPGFMEGLQQTQEGGRYRFWIPPDLGYGPGRTPRGAPFNDRDTLVFDVEVLRVVPGAAGLWEMQRMQRQMQGAPGAMPSVADPHGGTAPPPQAPDGAPPPGAR